MTVFLSTLSPGIGRAEKVGSSWSVETIAPTLDVRCLTVDPHKPGVVWAGTQGLGLWKSSDSGRNFVRSGLGGATVKSLAVSPSTPGLIFAGVKPAAVWASDDGSSSWEELAGFRKVRQFWWLSPAERPFSPYVQAIALSATVPGLIVAGIEAGAVVRSTDGGKTWQGHRHGSIRDCHSLDFAGDGRICEGGGTGGGAISVDGGATWSRPAGLDRKYGWAAALDRDGDTWYVSSTRGIEAHSKRADAAIWRAGRGAAWHRLGGGLPNPLNDMPYALIGGPEPRHLVAGLANGEVWESFDAGDSFARLPFKLPRIERVMVRIDE